jgi:hypothetical protein
MTRQIAVKVQDFGSTGSDAPEKRCKQNVFNARNKKADKFHAHIIITFGAS